MIKLKPMHYVTLGIACLVIFMVLSFLYVATGSYDDRAEAAFESRIDTDQELDFAAIEKKLVIEKTPQIIHEKQLNEVLEAQKRVQKRKQSPAEIIDSLTQYSHDLRQKYHTLQQQYNALQKHTKKKYLKSASLQKEAQIDFESYYSQRMNSKASDNREEQWHWLKLAVDECIQIREQSIVTFTIIDAAQLGRHMIPKKSKIEGVCHLGQSRIRVDFTRIYTITQEIAVHGNVYSLDKSRGIRARIKKGNVSFHAMKKGTQKALEYVDPTDILSGLLDEKTNTSEERYSQLDANTMLYARIKCKEEK